MVEKLNELKLIASISKRLKIRPNIGIRIKLASSAAANGKSREVMSVNSDLIPANYLKHWIFWKRIKCKIACI